MHDLVGTRPAFVGGDGFDPDAAALAEDAEVRLAALALTVRDGQQRPARLDQSAAEIHFPEAAIDVAGKALRKVGVGIGLVGRPHDFDLVVKLLLGPRFRGPQVHEAAIEIGAVDIEKFGHRQVPLGAAEHSVDTQALIAVRKHMLAKLANVAHPERHRRLQRAGKGRVVGPAHVGR